MRQRLAALALAGAGTIGAAAAFAASLPAATATTTAPAAPEIAALTAQEEAGKRIFTAGIGSGGRAITAVIGGSGGGGDGDPGVEVAASTLACAGCHGRDGKGGGEGGVFPSNLTWESLARPIEAGGERVVRSRPPYTDRLFKRAVTLGLDPAGNKLHVAMPRYQLTQEEAATLLAYVRRLGHEPEPGVTAQALQLGVLLPPAGQPPGAAAAIRAVLSAYFDDLNRTGGLYGRRLEARFEEVPAGSAERAAKLRELLDGEPPLFALAPSFVAGAEAETAAAVAAAQIPLVGALTPEPETAAPLNRYVFYLSSGLADQARALVSTIAPRLVRGRPLALLVDDAASANGARKEATDAALAEIRRQGLPEPLQLTAPASVDEARAAAARLAGAPAVLVLASGPGVSALLAATAERARPPYLLVPSAILTAGLQPPAVAGDRLLVAFSTPPADRAATLARDYDRLARLHTLPAEHRPLQRLALAGAEVLAEGIKRMGREASRERLIATLEAMYDFDAGTGAPIGFGPNRRIGAHGAYVATLDLAHQSMGDAAWTALTP